MTKPCETTALRRSTPARLAACVLGSMLFCAAPPAPAQSETTVGFVADEPGLSVLKRRVDDSFRAGSPPSEADFSLVCVAPCRARVDASPYQFAVRRSDGPILAGDQAYEVTAPSTFRTRVVSRAGTRSEGWYVLGIVGGAGVASTTTALFITCGEDRECAKWTSVAFWGGLGALSVGALIGLPMLTRKDELSITVVPGVPPAASASRFYPAFHDELALELPGLLLSGAF